jgi:preprotein translocase subunit SecD
MSSCASKAQSDAPPTKPQFVIMAGDVISTSVEVVTGKTPQDLSVVHLEFSGAKAAEFRQFTKDHLNQKVQIVVGTKIAEEPIIRAEIPSPKIDLTFSSPDEARAIADILIKK